MYKKLLILVVFLTILNALFADLRSAVDSLRLEIEKSSDVYKLHFDLGSCFYALRDYESALQEFNRALELKKDFPATEFQIALIYFHMDSLQKARDKFEGLRQKYPDKKSVYEWLGYIFGYAGEYEKMLTAFKEYYNRTHKEFFRGQNRGYDLSREVGMAYAMLKKYQEAISYYHKEIGYYRFRVEAKMELAMLYKKTNDIHKANGCFNEAIASLSKYYDYYNSELKKDLLLDYKSAWCYRLEEFDWGIALIDTLIQLKRESYINIYNLGVFRIASGDPRGLDDITKACIIDTTGFVQAVYGAIVAIKEDSLEKAEQSLKQPIPGLRRSGIAKGLLAWILEKLGKDTEAKKYWFKCYGQLPLGTDVESMRSFIDRFIETISL